MAGSRTRLWGVRGASRYHEKGTEGKGTEVHVFGPTSRNGIQRGCADTSSPRSGGIILDEPGCTRPNRGYPSRQDAMRGNPHQRRREGTFPPGPERPGGVRGKKDCVSCSPRNSNGDAGPRVRYGRKTKPGPTCAPCGMGARSEKRSGCSFITFRMYWGANTLLASMTLEMCPSLFNRSLALYRAR